MNIAYIKSLIEEKSKSAKNSDVKEAVEEIIKKVINRICEEESVSSLEELPDSKEINPALEECIKNLVYAI